MIDGFKSRTGLGLVLVILIGLFLTACGESTSTPVPVPGATTAVIASTGAATTFATTAIATPRATNPAAATPAQAAKARLYLRNGYAASGNQLVVLKMPGGTIERQVPLGVTNQNWTMLYTAIAGSDRTTVQAIDLTTGAVLRTTTLAGKYALPENESNARMGGLSPDGKTLVLAEVLSEPQKQKFTTEKRWISHLAVLDTGLQTPARILELDGNFVFDALSPDGAYLYMIEHLMPFEAGRYQVRQYNLATNQLNPQVVVEKGENETVMEGYGGAQVISPKGDWVFTFYQKTEHPFIHALNTENAFAVCLDLPPAGKLNDPTSKYWGLALNNKGTILYAVNSLLGQLAEINVSDFPQISRTVTIPVAAQGEVKQRPVGSAGVSFDGATLYALDNAGVLAIDTQTLKLRNRLATNQSFDSLVTSPSGAGLYLANSQQGKIFALDGASSTGVAELTAAAQPWRLLGVNTQP
jgi:hypothetical protein